MRRYVLFQCLRKLTSCDFLLSRYPNVNIHNFTTSWRDGMAFNALIHKHRFRRSAFMSRLQKFRSPTGRM